MDTLKSWKQTITSALVQHWVWLASIAAATLLATTPLFADENYKKAATTIGQVVLASGIAGAVIRSSTFTDMFIARIVDVFYESKHLHSRRDLAEICTRTLNALLEKESSVLRGAVGDELLNGYLDFKLGYVYKDFAVNIQVESFDATTNSITILETSRTTIVPNRNTNEFEVRWTWRSDASTAELVGMEIDNAEVPEDQWIKISEQGLEGYKYTHRLPNTAPGADRSVISFMRLVRKKVDLAKDPTSLYRFTAPCLGMSVQLMDFDESKLAVQLIPFGLPRNFEPDRKKTHWRDQRYRGLIFPRQGVMLQWKVK